MLRLFLAVDLPDRQRQEVAQMSGNVTNARWTKPEQLHITLRFMGKTPEAVLPEMGQRLSDIRFPSFELALSGVGVFPTRAQPANARVLWVGIHDPSVLGALKRTIDARLEGLVPPDEKTGFSPHLTLARFSRRPDKTLPRFLEEHGEYRSARWKVPCFRLYRSTLSSEGALHEVIDAYRLAEEQEA